MTFIFFARPGNSCVDSYFVCCGHIHTYPLSVCVITRVRNFVVDLLRGSTSVKEAKKLADCSYGDKLVTTRAIYKILKQIKGMAKPHRILKEVQSKKICLHRRSHCHCRCQRGGWSPNLCQGACLSSWHICWHGFYHPPWRAWVLPAHKSARWAPKLLSQERMEWRNFPCPDLARQIWLWFLRPGSSLRS